MGTTNDIAWVLACAGLVMFMQAGFCCLESGLVRAKNSINVAIKNLIDFCVAGVLFWLFGFGLLFGASWAGAIGTTGFFFTSASAADHVFFLFQMMFCGTATTIVAGAVAERMRFGGYLVIACVLSGLIYPLVGHWVWGGDFAGGAPGWLAGRGFIDFAGSTVVHSSGGWFALAAVLCIGPRVGRFGKGATTIHGHDVPMATLGAFILWFSWFGFNGGSALAFTDRTPLIMVNTCLSGMFGGIAALAYSWRRLRYPRVEEVINGALAGLVGITASCHIVTAPSAAMIGIVSGALCTAATQWLNRLEIDDVVGAFPVHACGGMWGTVAVALFGDPALWGTGLDRMAQLQVQLTGVGACCAVAFGGGYALLKAVNAVVPLRATAADEDLGLNVAEHSARTDLLDLLREMNTHWTEADFSRSVHVEPNTEIGKLATQYNRVLDRVMVEQKRSEAEAERALRAQRETAQANGELEETVRDLNTFNEVSVDRELRMLELKREINALHRELGRTAPYDLDGVGDKGEKA